jgi:hypothetical protein
MGVDRRIGAGTFIVAGGNYESRTWLQRWPNKYSDRDCSAASETYSKYLEETGTRGFENVDAARKSYFTDPVTYSYLLRGRPLMMLNARWDERIPRNHPLICGNRSENRPFPGTLQPMSQYGFSTPQFAPISSISFQQTVDNVLSMSQQCNVFAAYFYDN